MYVCFCSNICSPLRAGRITFPNAENYFFLNSTDCTMAVSISTSISMQETPQVHLNTSPTCFGGPWVRTVGFRGSARNLAFKHLKTQSVPNGMGRRRPLAARPQSAAAGDAGPYLSCEHPNMSRVLKPRFPENKF